jgi:hypothetical protein
MSVSASASTLANTNMTTTNTDQKQEQEQERVIDADQVNLSLLNKRNAILSDIVSSFTTIASKMSELDKNNIEFNKLHMGIINQLVTTQKQKNNGSSMLAGFREDNLSQ